MPTYRDQQKDERDQFLAELVRQTTQALNELAAAMRERQVGIEDPGPEARRLARQQIVVSVLGVLLSVVVSLIAVHLSIRAESLKSLEEIRRNDFAKAVSWADAGRTYSLREVDLSDRDLSGIDLGSDPNLPGSIGADLRGAKFVNARLYRTRLVSATLVAADLRRADLSLADLSLADLRGAILTEADLTGANLSRGNLFKADLSGTNLNLADLSGADLSLADLSGADLSSAILTKADLTGADLSFSDLIGADLSGVILIGADLKGAKFNEQTILPDGTKWTPDTDMARFTDPEHPDFWRSDHPFSPAYRPSEGDAGA
jgi:uncharacterized protein YjbI with pentapeptide repeats